MRSQLVRVDPAWRGETCVCIASGPSLTQADVDAVRGRARVIVINTSIRMAPWADVLWAVDAIWFEWYPEHQQFSGLKYSLDSHPKGPPIFRPADVRLLKEGLRLGLSRDPAVLHHGGNSGYSAINLAVHLGVSRILLLGYDMQFTGGRAHWHPDHPSGKQEVEKWAPRFQTLVAPLRDAGVEVINCSRQTALTCFPRMTIDQALLAREVAA